jgi:hypothetical protein
VPLPSSVTVTFSHQGELDTSVSVEEATADEAANVAAEATSKAASLSTSNSFAPAASGDLIAAAT